MIDVRSPIASRDPGGPTQGHLNSLLCRDGGVFLFGEGSLRGILEVPPRVI